MCGVKGEQENMSALADNKQVNCDADSAAQLVLYVCVCVYVCVCALAVPLPSSKLFKTINIHLTQHVQLAAPTLHLPLSLALIPSRTCALKVSKML